MALNIVLSNRDVTDADFQRTASIQSSTSQAISSNGTSGKSTLTRSVFANQLANAGISAVKSMFNYEVSRYGDLTGDYLGQAKIDRAFEVASVGTNLAGSIFGGAIAGGVAGAIVGGVIALTNLGVGAVQSSKTYDLNNFKANVNTSFNADRIGTILTAGGR